MFRVLALSTILISSQLIQVAIRQIVIKGVEIGAVAAVKIQQ